MQNKQVRHGGINIIEIKLFLDEFRAVATIDLQTSGKFLKKKLIHSRIRVAVIFAWDVQLAKLGIYSISEKEDNPIFLKIYFLKFPFRLIFFLEFQEYSIEWFAFRKFNNFWIFWNLKPKLLKFLPGCPRGSNFVYNATCLPANEIAHFSPNQR